MVMDTIPEEERCSCDPKVEKEGKQYVDLLWWECKPY